MCLGADVRRGPAQKPFDGRLDYDYLMWIDSDVVFKPAQFERLLSHRADIVAGQYLMENGTHFATVRTWDEDHFARHGAFEFATPESLNAACGLTEVAYTGMGFMLVKRGVFEQLDYPWFRPIEKRIGQAVDFTMEDVAFCLRATHAGILVLVDPAVLVGHEKKTVLLAKGGNMA